MTRIEVWDIDQRTPIDSFAPTSSPWMRIACPRDGGSLAAVRTGQLVLFDLATKRIAREWALNEKYEHNHCLAVSSDGHLVAIDDSITREHVWVYDRDSSEPPRSFPAESCNCVAFSPNGRWLAAGHFDHVRIFDLSAARPMRELKGHSNTLADLAFCPDGLWLATVSHDRLLKIWRLDTGEEQFSTVAHESRVSYVTFSPDGQTIATASHDGNLKLWHTATGQPLGELSFGNTPWVSCEGIAFSGDGRRLVGKFLTWSEYFVCVFDAADPSNTRPPVLKLTTELLQD